MQDINLNDFIQGCSDSELKQFSDNLNKLSDRELQLITNELSYSSRDRLK